MYRISKLLRQQALPCHWPTNQASGVGVDERFEALEEANDALIERVVRENPSSYRRENPYC